MSGRLPSYRANLTVGGALTSRKAMLETLVRHLDMVRLSIGMLSVVALVGCTGLIDNGNGGTGADSPAVHTAKAKWLDEAYPIFQANCTACHAGSMAGVGFLVGTAAPDIRDTLLGFDPQVVDLDAPESSRVLTKGLHDGPALLADQASALLDWVEAEKEAATPADGMGGPVLQTAEFTPILCTGGGAGTATCPYNHVDLTPTGLAGATIDFIAQPLGSGLYVNQLSLTAAASGAYIEHPLFVSWPGGGADPVPDDIDRFFDVKLDVMPAITDSIGGGTAAFVGFLATDPISIHFKVVTPYVPTTGGPGDGTTTGGCKVLPQFKTSAQGPLNTNCATCHTTAGATTNASAIAAMDLDGVAAADDASILLACNQVRSRINFQTTDQSGFYIAPNPADQTNHPFKFGNVQANFDAFKLSIDAWVQAEKTSP